MYSNTVVICTVSEVSRMLETMSDEGWELVAVIPAYKITDDFDENVDDYVSRRVSTRELYFKRSALPTSVLGIRSTGSRSTKPRPVPMNPPQR